MIKTFTTTALTLSLALATAAPAHAQLIHGGGLGGGLGGGIGGLGGGFGGNVVGDVGVDRATRSVDGSLRTNQTVRAPKTPKHVTAPVTSVATEATVATTVTATTPHLATGAIRGEVGGVTGRLDTVRGGARTLTREVIATRAPRVIFVPAVPDLVVRRTAIFDAGIAPIAYGDAPGYIDTQYQVLQNDLRGTGVEVSRRGEQIFLEMPGDVTFAFNKSDIQPRFNGVLNAVAATLTKFPATYVDVDGHTDAIGSEAYNQALSERRAASVAGYLSRSAVNPARLHVAGFGKTEPVASNATVMGRAANRRVEIVLTPVVQEAR